mmetsp:Transcript_11880/g.20179  ORF Transcript_11880/g.20179 Transcript_11880/m.20179 type:complete len:205 (+) Transcript_11880:1953-2567(+)
MTIQLFPIPFFPFDTNDIVVLIQAVAVTEIDEFIILLTHGRIQHNIFAAIGHILKAFVAHSRIAPEITATIFLMRFAAISHASPSICFLSTTQYERIDLHAAAKNSALSTNRPKHIKTEIICLRLHILHIYTHIIEARWWQHREGIFNHQGTLRLYILLHHLFRLLSPAAFLFPPFIKPTTVPCKPSPDVMIRRQAVPFSILYL